MSFFKQKPIVSFNFINLEGMKMAFLLCGCRLSTFIRHKTPCHMGIGLMHAPFKSSLLQKLLDKVLNQSGWHICCRSRDLNDLVADCWSSGVRFLIHEHCPADLSDRKTDLFYFNLIN